jgi:hypothetical protein
VAWPSERRERRDHDCCRVEGGVSLFEPPGEPSDREASAALAIPERDERGQLERLAQVKLADLACLDLRDDEIALLDRSPEGCSRVSVFAQVRLRPGAGRTGA